MASLTLLLLILLFFGVIRGQGALIMLSTLLLFTAFGSHFWSRHSTQRIRYRRYFDPPRIFPGEDTEYVVEVVNDKPLPLPWVRIEEHLPASVLPVVGGPAVTSRDGWERRRSVSLGWRERLVLRQRFTCAERGDHSIGPTDIETGDPLGFFPSHLRIDESRELLVYPRVARLDPLLAESRFPFGPANARPPVLEDPARFSGIRDYRPGDPMRWVDWKATARRMKLQTRVFAPTTLTNVVIALNVQTMPAAWQGFDMERLNASIGVAAALVRDAVAARHGVGLAVNGSGVGLEDFQVFLPPNRRPTQLEDTLAMLARLSPIPTMAFGPFLRRVAANFPYGASLVVVSAYLDQETAADLSILAERGHAVTLVFLGEEIPISVDPRVRRMTLPEVEFEPLMPAPSAP
jgi:uncharacterized protein (DUF58 family)